MSFDLLNLNPNIAKAIIACGYTTPTPIQAKCIPNIIEGKDIIASAQTGTGKTAAFVLPALHHLSTQSASKKTRILILTPTRELASQITTAAMQYGKFLNFNIVNLVGGMPYNQQIKELSRGANIIVATPGRLMDHIESKRVDLSSIEILVLDEADRMLDMGFIEDVEYIAKLTPAARQTLLFSATVDKELINVVRHLLKNPLRVDLSNDKLTIPKIEQLLYKANNAQHKARLLKHFLKDKNIFKAIIFSGTKINADKIADQLRDDGFAAAALHGDLRQNVRNRTIDQLRRGRIQFLVATDVAARGIDISDITHVINYDLPRFCEDYVHRIGRTGRAGKSGIAISFVLPTDTRNLQRIERYIGQRLHLISNVDVGQGESGSGDESGGESGGRRTTRITEKSSFKRDFERSDFRSKRSSSREDKPFGGRERSSFGDRERSSFRDKPSGDRERPSFRDKSSSGDRERPSFRDKPFGDRERPSFRDKPFGDRERSSFRDKPTGDRARSSFRDKPFGDKERPSFRDKPSFGDKERPSSYRDKPTADSDKISYRDKPSREANSDRSSAEKPFKKRFVSKSGGKFEGTRDKPFKKFGERSSTVKEGDRPFKKRSASRSDDAPEGTRGRGTFAKKADRPFRKSSVDKDKWQSTGEERRAKGE
jgi:superfamily II DNA/RNA helicase